MISFALSRRMTQLIILQRIELLGSFSKKVRKFFGRYLFTNLITKFFFNKKKIGEKFYAVSPLKNKSIPVEIVSSHYVDPKGERVRS